MVSFRDYEMYLLFLLLVKFHGSGKCEIYFAVQRILSFFLPCVVWSLDTENADPCFPKVMFVRMISTHKDGFQQFLYFKVKIWCWDYYLYTIKSDYNYDAIEIKSKGFYASSATIPYVQNLTSTLKLRSELFS